jgi:acyl phosphate:glycerol-3-phosphate acyltransferase
MSEAVPITPVLIAVAYLLGSIPFGLLLAKLFGTADIRKTGSGNIGATNVARVAGPLAGILTLLLDALKGAAVWIASQFTHSAKTMMLAGLAALIGHCFPIVVGVWRYVSLGSVSAAAAVPLLVYFLYAPGHAPPLSIIFGTLAAAALVIYKHDPNLQRLVDGTEPKFHFGKSEGGDT